VGRARGVKTEIAPRLDEANALALAKRTDPAALIALARAISDWKQEIIDGPARDQERR
jgi:hypothetical protein